MNQYIITEELLDEIGKYSPSTASKIRFYNISHPYNPQAERERVLDEFYNKLDMDNEHRCFLLDENARLMTFSIQDIEQYLEEFKEDLRNPSGVLESEQPDLSHITPERRGCLTCLAPDCPVWQAADQNCWKPIPAPEREEWQRASLQDGEKFIRQVEREKVLDIIKSGKSALYELSHDGEWSHTLQAKMDVLCWIEEKLRQKAGE